MRTCFPPMSSPAQEGSQAQEGAAPISSLDGSAMSSLARGGSQALEATPMSSLAQDGSQAQEGAAPMSSLAQSSLAQEKTLGALLAVELPAGFLFHLLLQAILTSSPPVRRPVARVEFRRRS